MSWDKLFEIVLVFINFIFDKVADRETAIKRFREVFNKIEARNEPAEILDEAERQLLDVKKGD
jgi:uncharacterized protein (UPF0218 family)